MDQKVINIGVVPIKIVPLKIAKLEKIGEMIKDDLTIIEQLQSAVGEDGTFDFANMVTGILRLSSKTIYTLVLMVSKTIGEEKLTTDILEEELDITHINDIAEAFWEVNFSQIPFLIGKLKPILSGIMPTITSPDSGTASSPPTQVTPLVEQSGS